MDKKSDFLKIEGSSQIKGVRHIENENRLEIKFHNDTVYSYSPVSRLEYNKLISAESVGSYFHKNIRNNDKITSTKVSNG